MIELDPEDLNIVEERVGGWIELVAKGVVDGIAIELVPEVVDTVEE